jgi:hypothetical protein
LLLLLLLPLLLLVQLPPEPKFAVSPASNAFGLSVQPAGLPVLPDVLVGRWQQLLLPNGVPAELAAPQHQLLLDPRPQLLLAPLTLTQLADAMVEPLQLPGHTSA